MAADFQTPPYWLVWREGGGAPTYRHPDQYSAETEAKRLAHACPGETFLVLCPVASVVVSSMTFTRFDPGDNIPF